MNKYGREVHSVNSDGAITGNAKCFIQPLRYKNKMYIEGTPTPVGINDSGYFLFLGPPEFDIESLGEKGYICDGTKRYHIDRTEQIFIKNEPVYIWAVLKEITQGDYPYYDHFV